MQRSTAGGQLVATMVASSVANNSQRTLKTSRHGLLERLKRQLVTADQSGRFAVRSLAPGGYVLYGAHPLSSVMPPRAPVKGALISSCSFYCPHVIDVRLAGKRCPRRSLARLVVVLSHFAKVRPHVQVRTEDCDETHLCFDSGCCADYDCG